jgi:hypothetical protein
MRPNKRNIFWLFECSVNIFIGQEYDKNTGTLQFFSYKYITIPNKINERYIKYNQVENIFKYVIQNDYISSNHNRNLRKIIINEIHNSSYQRFLKFQRNNTKFDDYTLDELINEGLIDFDELDL